MAYDDQKPPLTDGDDIGEIRGNWRWTGTRWVLTDGTNVGEVRDGYRWTGTKWVPATGTGTGTGAAHVAPDPYDRRDKRDDDKKKWATALAILIGLILLGLLIWWIIDQNNDDDEDQPNVEPTPIASIGTPVQDGDLEFTVTGLQPDVETVGGGENTVTADGSYTLVALRVTNNSGDPVEFSSENVDAIDTEGDTLDAVGDADPYIVNGGAGFDGDIAANQTINTVVAFDVDDNATLDKVVVHEPASSDGQEIDVS
jgi:Domain of unknown function (DUF4352)